MSSRAGGTASHSSRSAPTRPVSPIRKVPRMLPQWLLVVDVAVAESAEPAWNQWYTETHLPEILACPQFIRAARYVSDPGGGADRRYLTIYELESGDAMKSREFAARRGWAQFASYVDATVRPFWRIAAAEHR
jgi:hypothetical protein